MNPISGFQVGLQMAHRIGAVLILGLVGWAALCAARQFGRAVWPTRLSLGWLGLILVQAGLGIVTIWTNKSADIATARRVLLAMLFNLTREAMAHDEMAPLEPRRRKKATRAK